MAPELECQWNRIPETSCLLDVPGKYFRPFWMAYHCSDTLRSPLKNVGSKNPRKQFQAELADPYAEPDSEIVKTVEAALRVVCMALASTSESDAKVPDDSLRKLLIETVPSKHVAGVVASMEYLRDRIGVPRDLPLAAARYLRAYLNWGIGVLSA